MSTVKTNNVQVGTSGTATNNFTWYQPATPDGTVRLGVGNTGATTADVVTANSSGAVGFGGTNYGTSGQVLQSNGSSSPPTWATPSGGVTSFNTRTGAVTLTSTDVTTALTYTPLNASNPSYTGTLTGGTGVVNLGSNQFYKDANGRIGVGVVPSAWSGAVPLAVDFSGGGYVSANSGGGVYVGTNLYYNGTNWIYKTTAAGGIVSFDPGGSSTWYRAASGSAGATAALVTLMQLDTSGNLAFNSGYGSAATAYGCRAWVNFNGTTSPGTIRSSGNVSSVTKNGTGDYTVNFTNSMPDVNYSMVGCCSYVIGGGASFNTFIPSYGAVPAVGSCRVATGFSSSLTDMAVVNIAVFR